MSRTYNIPITPMNKGIINQLLFDIFVVGEVDLSHYKLSNLKENDILMLGSFLKIRISVKIDDVFSKLTILEINKKQFIHNPEEFREEGLTHRDYYHKKELTNFLISNYSLDLNSFDLNSKNSSVIISTPTVIELGVDSLSNPESTNLLDVKKIFIINNNLIFLLDKTETISIPIKQIKDVFIDIIGTTAVFSLIARGLVLTDITIVLDKMDTDTLKSFIKLRNQILLHI